MYEKNIAGCIIGSCSQSFVARTIRWFRKAVYVFFFLSDEDKPQVDSHIEYGLGLLTAEDIKDKNQKFFDYWYKHQEKQWIVSAEWPMIVLKPMYEKIQKGKSLIVYSTPYDPERLLETKKLAISLEGKKYGALQLVGMIGVGWFEALGIRVKNIFPWNYHCSEVVCILVKKVLSRISKFFGLIKDEDPSSVAPDRIIRLAMKSGECKIIGECKIGETEITWI